jgi:manganese/zinc/iron transport system substrate-binding protein
VFRPSRRSLIVALAAALTVLGGPIAAPAHAAEPLKLVATTGMIADTVSRVAGDRAEVTALMGPGVDPHTYRQTRSDIARMISADAVFWNGLYLEAQLEEFFGQLGQRKPVFAVGEGVPVDRRLAHDSYQDRYDPHVWMDPALWRFVVAATRDALIELDAEGADTYSANAEAMIADLDRLDAYSRKVLGEVPPTARVVVTAHDAFRYFGRSYGFEVIGVQGISTESEAGLKHIEEMVSTLVDRKIGAIFVESSVSDRNVRALVEGAAAQGWTVKIGGQLFSDAMGAPGTYEGTYLGMIDHNVTTIAGALGAPVPQGGLDGRLAATN